jgi:hypothetical protein
MTVGRFHALVDRYALRGVLAPVFGFLLAGNRVEDIATRMGWSVAYARTVISRVLSHVDSKGDRHAICRRIADELYAEVPVVDPLVLAPVRDAEVRQRHRGGAYGGRKKARGGLNEWVPAGRRARYDSG